MKHIGYNWYTKIMKWNPHVPKNISFFFILILFIKRKKFDNPKVQISSKPKTIFSIHPVSRRNRAKFFPCEIKINKKSRVLERRFLETWVAQPEPNGRIFFHFTVKTFWPTLQMFWPLRLRGLEIAGDLQGKSALSMEKGCKNCRVSPKFLQPLFSLQVPRNF